MGVRHLLRAAGIAAGLVLSALPALGSADGGQPDLEVQLASYDKATNRVGFLVSNESSATAPSTTLAVQTLAPGATTGGASMQLSVPSLKAGQHTSLSYTLPQACAAGLRVQAQLNLDGDPTPDNNNLLAYVCQPDLRLTFESASANSVKFRVSEVGGQPSPATSVHFETETNPPSDPVDVKLGALGVGESKTLDYGLTAPCPGVAVKAQVALDGDANPDDNTLQLFPCDADLAVSFQDFVGGSDNLAFVVTNLGGVTSPATTVDVQTVLPPPPTNDRIVPVPALAHGATFAFTYTLASGCNGNDVRATVSLPTDPNPSNNTTQVTACGKAVPGTIFVPGESTQKIPVPANPYVQSPADVGQAAQIAHDLTTPDYLQPGEHTMDLLPSLIRDADLTHNGGGGLLGGCLLPVTDLEAGFEGLVGWQQDGIGCYTDVSETAMRFDISPLLRGGPKLVTSAQVTFDEKQISWTNGDGTPRDATGCVAELGIATNDFTIYDNARGADQNGLNVLFPNDVFDDVTPGATRNFDVTQPVAGWFAPDNPRFGFVLRGSIENVENDDASSCLSEISNISLHIGYTVL